MRRDILAGFVMSLLVFAGGVVLIARGPSWNLTPANLVLVVGLLALVVSVLGVNLCGTLLALSARLAKVEKELDRRK
jgi:hypothetical protein